MHDFIDVAAVQRLYARVGAPPPLSLLLQHRSLIPVPAFVDVLAMQRPDEPALILGAGSSPEAITRAELAGAVTAASLRLHEAGVVQGDWVGVALPNGADHVVATLAVWRVGATPVPLPDGTQGASLPGGRVRHVIADCRGWRSHRGGRYDPSTRDQWSFRVPDPYAVLSSGGSSGRPRLIPQPSGLWGRARVSKRDQHRYGLRLGQTQLVTLPLSHGFGFSYAYARGLAYGHCLVFPASLEPDVVLRAIAEERVEYMAVVPVMLERLRRAGGFEKFDAGSLETLLHGGARCSEVTRAAWFAKVGPNRVVEAYGATDFDIQCMIWGDEWLQRVGSVGRPEQGGIEIRTPDGAAAAPGEEGMIWASPRVNSSPHQPLQPTGDLGLLDGDGFLYIVGRADRVIDCGGVNVSPEVVETRLIEHVAVADVVVLGASDALGNSRLHALVQPAAAVTADELMLWCRSALPREFVPRRVTFVDQVPRSKAGKVKYGVNLL
ncbi:class I adenylate-forming enzyme family protein [Trujillonella humicola]|uniref:class I adenylate-forming enzyme family protein n=1 Tax=Trujillonella humicola TaxID=3383699 RepID=UPI00390586A6